MKYLQANIDNSGRLQNRLVSSLNIEGDMRQMNYKLYRRLSLNFFPLRKPVYAQLNDQLVEYFNHVGSIGFMLQ